jgi:hypothetical protein
MNKPASAFGRSRLAYTISTHRPEHLKRYYLFNSFHRKLNIAHRSYELTASSHEVFRTSRPTCSSFGPAAPERYPRDEWPRRECRAGMVSEGEFPAGDGLVSAQIAHVMRSHQINRELTGKDTVPETGSTQPLDAQEVQELLQKIEEDPSFVNTLSKEKAFRLFIQAKVPQQRPSQELIRNIKDSIRREAAREIGL